MYPFSNAASPPPIDDEDDYDAEFNRQLELLKVTLTTVLIPFLFKFLGRRTIFLGVVPLLSRFVKVPQLFF